MDSIDLFLSPHLDDAPTSCGGLIHQLATRGRHVIAATIFAGVPDGRVSAYADEVHRSWRMNTAAVAIGARREEDRRAMAITGGEPLHLDLLDAIYRRNGTGWLCESWRDVTGEPRDDAGFASTIVDRGREAPASHRIGTIYAPLGVGNHVDHQWTHRAARQLGDRGHAVLFYEEVPGHCRIQRIVVSGGGLS